MKHINWITNAEFCNIIRKNLWKIPHNIDGVICIPRGGLFVGSMIAEFLNKPLYTINGFLKGESLGGGLALNTIQRSDSRTYIVVDDSISSGASMRSVKEKFASRSERFIYVAAIGEKEEYKECDIVLEVVKELRFFELNFFRTEWVSNCVFDIDGVLCPDPEPGIDLDINKYTNHILNAPPLIIPQFQIGAICTHRPRSFYKQTLEWLEKNHIGVDEIFMGNYDSIQEKITKMNSDEFIQMKANVYDLYPDAIMFVESNWTEAQRIFDFTHRPVLCTDANIVLQDE